MMKRQRFTPGAIVKIPINSTYHTYGRLLVSPYVEVFDCRTREEMENLDLMITKPILFTICVFVRKVLSTHTWKIVGVRHFNEVATQSPLLFMQDVYYLERCSVIDWYGNKTAATIDDCRDLENMVVWNAEQVAERLEDHYAGRKNGTLESSRLKEKEG